MAWKIELSERADRELTKLDPQNSKRIPQYIRDRLACLENPRSLGRALQGPEFGELRRYRVGDFRVICRIEDEKLVILVVGVGHRKEIYR
jgi:mRNA interferase RelE/StbE